MKRFALLAAVATVAVVSQAEPAEAQCRDCIRKHRNTDGSFNQYEYFKARKRPFWRRGRRSGGNCPPSGGG